jgi:hypothetical protein
MDGKPPDERKHTTPAMFTHPSEKKLAAILYNRKMPVSHSSTSPAAKIASAPSFEDGANEMAGQWVQTLAGKLSMREPWWSHNARPELKPN